MDVNDFIGLTELKTGSGIDIGFNKPAAGGIYVPAMLKVEDYDIKDWSPVFNQGIIKSFNISIGYKATVSATTVNSIAIGTHVHPTGNNIIQFGRWDQTILTYGEVGIRNDERDIVTSSIADVTLGLDFIDQLRPVKYQLNYRETQIEEEYPFPHPINEPIAPDIDDYKIINADGDEITDTVSYNNALSTFNRKNTYYTDYCNLVEEICTLRSAAYNTASGVQPLQQFVFGFIGKEVRDAGQTQDSDFNPCIDQSDNGGYDVLHYYPSQLQAPIVKALQQAHELIKTLRRDVDQLRTDVDALRTDTDTLKTQMTEVREQLGLT